MFTPGNTVKFRCQSRPALCYLCIAAALVYLALFMLAAEPGLVIPELTRKLGEEFEETTLLEFDVETDRC